MENKLCMLLKIALTMKRDPTPAGMTFGCAVILRSCFVWKCRCEECIYKLCCATS